MTGRLPSIRVGCVAFVLLLTANAFAWQATDTAPAEERAAGVARTGSALQADMSSPMADRVVDLLPTLDAATRTWLAVLFILVLMLQLRPALTIHNLDALVLAFSGILLALRHDPTPVQTSGAGLTLQQWSHILLAVACGYWLLRGLMLIHARAIPAARPNVSEASMLVLIIAALVIAFGQIRSAPLTRASHDGLLGGVYMAGTGKLPYGDLSGADSFSPLLYAAHAGVAALMPPSVAGDTAVPMTWSSREQWESVNWRAQVDSTPARVVNGLLVALTLAAILVIGKRLHSTAMGFTLLTVYLVFPGSMECFTRPDIMLASMLLAWTVAFALTPGVAGIASMLLAVLAGLAWPWAWLSIPVLLGYFLRQGWNGVGASFGLLVGIASVALGILGLVEPAPPRVDGALAAAGLRPALTAGLDERGELVYTPYAEERPVESDFRAAFWSTLLRAESVRTGRPENDALIRDVAAEGPARDALRARYRGEARNLREMPRLMMSTRTLLEQTWLPEQPVQPVADSSWHVLRTSGPSPALVDNIRRGAKVVLGLLTLLVTVILLRAMTRRAAHLVGGLTAVLAAALIVSEPSSANNWAWLLPLPLALFAVSAAPPPAAVVAVRTGPPAATPPRAAPPASPRITVNP